MERAGTVFTISQINEYVRMVLDGNELLHSVWLRGEISNFTNHYKTGHFYFSLKDENSSIRAVMFRGNNQRLGFSLEDGMRVLAHGEIRSYPRDGQTQIVVDEIQPDGAGTMALAFEQTRRRLESEGLLDSARKKKLPPFPRKIGVITSPTGAAIHDIIRITGRRFPCAELILFPALVQGTGAAASLRCGVEFFNSVSLVDEIIIGRGGGSMEDLWAFNDEALARTIAASRLPVISAVGHESDVTICDLVADLRAPTPSGAAELAVPDSSELALRLEQTGARLNALTRQQLEAMRSEMKLRAGHRMFSSPQALFDERRMHLIAREEKIEHAIDVRLTRERAGLAAVCARMESLNPLAVLSRGYTMVTDEDGQTHSTLASLDVGQTIILRFKDGDARAGILEKHPRRESDPT